MQKKEGSLLFTLCIIPIFQSWTWIRFILLKSRSSTGLWTRKSYSYKLRLCSIKTETPLNGFELKFYLKIFDGLIFANLRGHFTNLCRSRFLFSYKQRLLRGSANMRFAKVDILKKKKKYFFLLGRQRFFPSDVYIFLVQGCQIARTYWAKKSKPNRVTFAFNIFYPNCQMVS